MPKWSVVIPMHGVLTMEADTVSIEGDKGTARMIVRFHTAGQVVAEFYDAQCWWKEDLKHKFYPING